MFLLNILVLRCGCYKAGESYSIVGQWGRDSGARGPLTDTRAYVILRCPVEERRMCYTTQTQKRGTIGGVAPAPPPRAAPETAKRARGRTRDERGPYLQVVRGRREAQAGGGQQPLVRVVHADAVGLRAV